MEFFWLPSNQQGLQVVYPHHQLHWCVEIGELYQRSSHLHVHDKVFHSIYASYPYETKFLKRLPGWPTVQACEQIKGASLEM